MKLRHLWSLLFLAWATPAVAQVTSNRFAVLDFDEIGSVAPGVGETLAMILYNSLNARRYDLVDPNHIRELLQKHQWRKQRLVSAGLQKDLQGLGVRFLVTGSVSRAYDVFSATYRVSMISGKVLYSDVLPPVQQWYALIASLQYSVRMLTRQPDSAPATPGAVNPALAAARLNILRKMAEAAKKKAAAAASPLKAFDEMIKDAKKLDGLFPIHVREEKTGLFTYLMEVSPDQLNKLFLFSPTLESGTGGFVVPFAVLDEYAFYFKREENRILLVEKNLRYRAYPKVPIARVMKRSFSDAIRGFTLIVSQPHPKTKNFLIDFKTLILQPELLDLGAAAAFFVADKFLTRISKIQNFPKNTEIAIKSYVRTRFRDPALPSPGPKLLTWRYSLSALPDAAYRPRFADERVGHFLMLAKDFTRDDVDSRYIRLVTRWRLEKKDPSAAMSAPKEPIVFWLENTIPTPYRRAVAQGILMWNQAFEKIGFKGAVEAKVQPDNATWDGADIRYNTIRWFAAENATFAQGPSRVNPITGEIFDADIRVAADMVLFTFRNFASQIEPLRWLQGSGLESFLDTSSQVQRLRSFHDILTSIQTFEKKEKAARHDPRHCRYAEGAKLHAVLGWHVAALRGDHLPSSFAARRYVYDFLVHVIAHEVGHTLGLRHNFKASTLHDLKDLHNPAKTRVVGLTNSVMEYAPVNLAPPGMKQGEYWQTVLGPYDHWAIEYAYKPLPEAKNAREEIPLLKKIASRVADPALAYATDEDTFGYASPMSVDPEASVWDLGRDPLAHYKGRVAIAREIWSKIETKLGTPVFGYQKMRDVFLSGASAYLMAGLQATKFVGGLYHRRDQVGDPKGRLPFEPVSAEKQRETLDFLIKHYFSQQALDWSPSLLNKLAPTRFWDFQFSVFRSRIDTPIHQIQALLQVMPLYRLFHPMVLERVQDTQMRLPKGAPYLSLSEIFSSVSNAIWSELTDKSQPSAEAPEKPKAEEEATSRPSSRPAAPQVSDAPPTPAPLTPTLAISSSRRNLQNYHLEMLIAYATFASTNAVDAPLIARSELQRLHRSIQAVQALPKDEITDQHLTRIQARIEQALNTVQIRLR